MTKNFKIKKTLWGSNSQAGHQPTITTTTPKSLLWAGDTEKLSIDFSSHALLFLV